jgi:hypothetical protein
MSNTLHRALWLFKDDLLPRSAQLFGHWMRHQRGEDQKHPCNISCFHPLTTPSLHCEARSYPQGMAHPSYLLPLNELCNEQYGVIQKDCLGWQESLAKRVSNAEHTVASTEE